MEEKDFISFERSHPPFSKKVAAFSLAMAILLEITTQNPSLQKKYVAEPLEKFRDEVVTFLGDKKADSLPVPRMSKTNNQTRQFPIKKSNLFFIPALK